MGKRHFHDHILGEPGGALFLRQLVAGSGIAARIDGATCQDHALWRVLVVAGIHQRHRGHDRNRGLAHGHDINVAAQDLEHFDDVIDIILKIEFSHRQGNGAGIGPVGNVNIEVGQQGLDGAAQQGGIVA